MRRTFGKYMAESWKATRLMKRPSSEVIPILEAAPMKVGAPLNTARAKTADMTRCGTRAMRSRDGCA